MKLRMVIAVGAVTAGATLLLRKVGLHEDLEWETVQNPGSLIDIEGGRGCRGGHVTRSFSEPEPAAAPAPRGRTPLAADLRPVIR